MPSDQSWWSRLLTTDFCPWANRFVYWLKEPVGWFALATAISVIIGLYFSPIGWTLAASLTAIMATGMAWPWVAVRVTQCDLHPETDAVHEDTACRMVLSIRNRIPIPVWGLAIEAYLENIANDDNVPTVGLACVPPLCTADYCVNVTPTLRGHYPTTKPQVACSFPFGIWTARRELRDVRPLTVWPRVYRVLGVLPIIGQINADEGDGSRGGRSGDFVGVRSFRRGDSAKHVNWVASARSECLIVTERGGPQSVELDVFIDTSSNASRESLARRIRVAASILDSLHQSRIRARVRLGNDRLTYKCDSRGRRQMLDALAGVPVDGEPCEPIHRANAKARIGISGSASGEVVIQIQDPLGSRRAGGATREIFIGLRDDLATAIAGLWKEIRDADVAA
ncbi:protein containing DUF58 [Rhodopirellula maiorica SM1]|uniref:Protein containing DUF58 n=2 Tax=Novipirellula TaxID=2795426 RepID=M5S8H8_9BACT|nr:protein containing DUF58 [Rhodopirellula maiorica SM1]